MDTNKMRNLKALAEVATGGEWACSEKHDGRFWHIQAGSQAIGATHAAGRKSSMAGMFEANAKFIAAASPAAVIALLAEIEQLQEHKQQLVDLRETHGFDCWAAALVEIDRLKAENEALRTGQAIKRLSCAEVREAYNGAYYQPRDLGSDGEQCRAGVVAVIDAAMAKEASHG